MKTFRQSEAEATSHWKSSWRRAVFHGSILKVRATASFSHVANNVCDHLLLCCLWKRRCRHRSTPSWEGLAVTLALECWSGRMSRVQVLQLSLTPLSRSRIGERWRWILVWICALTIGHCNLDLSLSDLCTLSRTDSSFHWKDRRSSVSRHGWSQRNSFWPYDCEWLRMLFDLKRCYRHCPCL